MDQEKLLETAGESFGYAKAYIERRIELTRLELVEKSAVGIATLLTLFIVGLTVLGVLLLLTLALGIYLGDKMGSYSLSFLILAGFYALISLLVFLFRKPLIMRPILTNAIRNLNEEQQD